MHLEEICILHSVVAQNTEIVRKACYDFCKLTRGLNIYSMTNSCTFKSATNSSTFESATIFFQKNKYGWKCLKLPKSSRNAKRISGIFKSTTISRTFECTTNSRTAEVQALCMYLYLVLWPQYPSPGKTTCAGGTTRRISLLLWSFLFELIVKCMKQTISTFPF